MEEKNHHWNFLNKIHVCGLVPIYPNLTTASKIFLTLPVTIVSAESSFSKLKLTKNYSRTSMSQDRLSNLSMISIESELLDSIPQETIIEKFAAAKARQIKTKKMYQPNEFNIMFYFLTRNIFKLFTFSFLNKHNNYNFSYFHIQ